MVYFPESARYAVVGNSRNLIARAPLTLATDQEISIFLKDVQKAFGDNVRLKNTIIVSGINPILLREGRVTRYTTLIDNRNGMLEFLHTYFTPAVSEDSIKRYHTQLGHFTPEGGQNKVKEFKDDGTCLYLAGTQSGREKDERWVRIPVSLHFDAGLLVEMVEELGLGMTDASRRGILERINGLKGIRGGFRFRGTNNQRYFCIDEVPILGINKYDAERGRGNVYIVPEEAALGKIRYAFENVPATLTYGHNVDFGWLIFVANYMPVLHEDIAAKTPLSMECEGYPFVLPLDEIGGKKTVVVTKYDGTKYRKETLDFITTITTQGMWTGATHFQFWKDMIGCSIMPEELEQYADRAVLPSYVGDAIMGHPVQTLDECISFFKEHEVQPRLEQMIK